MNYGAMAALSCFAMFMLIYLMGINPLGPASWMAVWIPPLFIYLSIRYYRNELSGGYVKFADAFRAGMLTSFGCALLYALMVYIFGKIADPGLMDSFRETMLQNLETTETEMRNMLGDTMYERSVEEMKNMTLANQAFSDFLYKIISGTVFSLIFAAIMKKKSPEII